MTVDVLLEIAQKQGMFVALVLFVIWEARSREAKFAQREADYIIETKEREAKYIEREEKYQNLIQSLTDSLSEFADMKEDVAFLRNQIEISNAIAQHGMMHGNKGGAST